MKFRRLTVLIIAIGFCASFVLFCTGQFPWVSLVIGLPTTLVLATLVYLALGNRNEALRLVGVLEGKNSQLEEALQRQARAEQSLRQAQRMEAVGQLAGGIAHDFNNMLQVILSYSEFLSDGIDPDSELQSDVAEVQKAARRASGLTRQLQVFSRQNTAQPGVIDLSATVRNTEHLLRDALGDDIALTCQTTAEPCLVLGDTGELELLLMNLALNARDAMPCGGEIRVTVDTVDVDDLGSEGSPSHSGPFARIDVTDNGEGMTPDVTAKAFEPFFTTKETGRGTGLGLSMVYGIANRSGGSASIVSESGVGTTVSVLFPLDEPKSGIGGADARARRSERVPTHEIIRKQPAAR